MGFRDRFSGPAALAFILAAGLIVASCGGPAAAQEMEVTFYYLPG